MSSGYQEVCSEAIEEVGDILLRILERVARNLRRRRCGKKACNEGQERGTLLEERMRAASSRKGVYRGAMLQKRWLVRCGRRSGGVAVCWLGAAKAEAETMRRYQEVAEVVQ